MKINLSNEKISKNGYIVNSQIKPINSKLS